MNTEYVSAVSGLGQPESNCPCPELSLIATWPEQEIQISGHVARGHTRDLIANWVMGACNWWPRCCGPHVAAAEDVIVAVTMFQCAPLNHKVTSYATKTESLDNVLTYYTSISCEM